MENKKAFLVITAVANKAHMAEVPAYLGNVMPIFGRHGGKPFGRFKTIQNLSGDDSPEMVGIIEFPSSEAIHAVVNGEDFRGLSESRAKAFTKLNMVLCEEM